MFGKALQSGERLFTEIVVAYLLGLLLAESCSVSRLEAARVWGSRLLQRTRRVRDPGAGTQTWAAGALPNRCLQSGTRNALVHYDKKSHTHKQ